MATKKKKSEVENGSVLNGFHAFARTYHQLSDLSPIKMWNYYNYQV